MGSERKTSRIVLAAAIYMGVTTFAAPAAAQISESASERAAEAFQQGVTLQNAGDFDGALKAYWDAYNTQPHYVVMCNIAAVELERERDVEAATALRRCLAEGGASDERKAEFEAALQEVKQRIAELQVEVQPPEAQLTLNGQPGEITPDKPLFLPPGTHRTSAVAEGYVAHDGTVSLAPGEQKLVTIELTPAKPKTVQLQVTCPVPDVHVAVTPVIADASPIELVLGSTMDLAPGSYRVVFTKADGTTTDQSIALDDGVRSVDCGWLLGAERPSTDTAEILGYVGLGVGVAMGIGTLLHYQWNAERYDEFQRNPNQKLADSIDSAEPVTLGLGVGAGLFAIGGVISLGTSDTFMVERDRGQEGALPGASLVYSSTW